MPRLAASICALVVVCAICAACSEPPQKEIDRAQGAIDAAKAAGAEQYAATEYQAAITAQQDAHSAVDQRDYRLALSKALDASERAQQAARQAADGKARARSDVEQSIATTATAVQQLHSALKVAESSRVPAPALASARQGLARAESTLQKARALLKAEQYLDARDALKGTGDRISEQIRALNEARRRAGARRRS
jgi:hypothetical protein